MNFTGSSANNVKMKSADKRPTLKPNFTVGNTWVSRFLTILLPVYNDQRSKKRLRDVSMNIELGWVDSVFIPKLPPKPRPSHRPTLSLQLNQNETSLLLTQLAHAGRDESNVPSAINNVAAAQGRFLNFLNCNFRATHAALR